MCILRDHVVQSPDESLFFIPIYDLFRASRCTCVKDRTACRSCLFSRVGGECLDPDSGPQAVWQVPSVSWLSSPQVDFLRTLIFPFLFKTVLCVFSACLGPCVKLRVSGSVEVPFPVEPSPRLELFLIYAL